MEVLKLEKDTTSSEIAKIIEKNIIEANHLRSEINRLKNYEIEEQEEVVEDVKIDIKTETIKDDDFEDEVDYYLEDYRNFEGEITKEKLLEILPSESSYRYKELLMRLHAESIKDIKEFEELFIIEDDIRTLNDLKEEILREKQKIKCIKECLNNNEEKEEKLEHKNKLILAPSSSGKIVIIDDLKHIPSEYYVAFYELIESIKDNTFKGVKRLSNDSIYGTSVSEVRGDGIRVLFQRLNKDTYSLITAFLKKTDSNRGYKEFVRNRISSYSQISDFIKESLDDEDFIKENELNLEEMYRILGKDNKIYKIGDKNA